MPAQLGLRREELTSIIGLPGKGITASGTKPGPEDAAEFVDQ